MSRTWSAEPPLNADMSPRRDKAVGGELASTQGLNRSAFEKQTSHQKRVTATSSQQGTCLYLHLKTEIYQVRHINNVNYLCILYIF